MRVMVLFSLLLAVAGCGASPARPDDAACGIPGGRAASFQGRLLTSAGQPVAGATVRIGEVSAASAGDGSFVLAGLNSGEATISIAREQRPGAGGSVILVPGANRLDIPMPDFNEGFLAGRVLDACTFQPIAGAAVRGATTDATGSFDVPACCGTIGTVTATKPGYEPSSKIAGRAYSSTVVLDFVLTPE